MYTPQESRGKWTPYFDYVKTVYESPVFFESENNRVVTTTGPEALYRIYGNIGSNRFQTDLECMGEVKFDRNWTKSDNLKKHSLTKEETLQTIVTNIMVKEYLHNKIRTKLPESAPSLADAISEEFERYKTELNAKAEPKFKI
ncbi:MAG: hypothetical protein WC627_12900 [Legionella sp.]|jgi:hypothetical protein